MTANERLGVSATASEEEIRAAYLSKVKEFPPDRSPLEFEAIRDAYDALCDPRTLPGDAAFHRFERAPGLAAGWPSVAAQLCWPATLARGIED